MLKAALEYRSFNFSVIPVGKDKKPLVKWEKYQKKRATKDEIEQWFNQWPDANIAIVTGTISGISVIDIDSPEGTREIFKRLPKGFTTVSAQSPHGRHLYFKHVMGLRNNSRVLGGCDLRAEGGYIIAPPSRLGNGSSYKWIHKVGEVTIKHMPEWYLKMVKEDPKPTARSKSSFKLVAGSRDESLFHAASCLIKGGMAKENVVTCLKILARNCDPPFKAKEALIKVASAYRRQGAAERGLTERITDWLQAGSGEFSTVDLYQDLCIHTAEQKRYAYKVLTRKTEAGIIEKCGSKRGHFRVVESTCLPVDWMSVSTSEYPILMPFKLHQMIKVMPGNVIVIAGEQNAGKTALMLNMVRWNMDKLKCHYFTSEMAEAEVKERLEEFQLPLKEWKFNVYERTRNFHQVLKPDDLNFIDYMEVETEFYLVGKYINQVHEALGRGVAVIGLQKSSHTNLGRGGSFALEKPRLYMTLSHKGGKKSELKIEKAKIYRDKKNNPNGQALVFRIENGALLIVEKDWHQKAIDW